MANISTVKCGICDAETVNGFICTDCQESLRSIVIRAGISKNAPHQLCVLDELDVQMSRQSRDAPRYGGRSAETPIPFDSRAAKAHSMLADSLTRWARHYGAPSTVLIGPRRCARWLLHSISVIALAPGAELMYSDLDRAVADALSLMDRPESKDYIGICSSLNDGVFCDIDLYAIQGEPFLTCPRCATIHDVGGRREIMLEAAHDVLLNGVDMARIANIMGLQVSAQGIYRWRNRGRLTVRATNAQGHPMYRLGDVLDLARASILRGTGVRG
jgi:hypothetical protein